MLTVTATNLEESRAAIESLNVGDSLRCPSVSGFTFRAESRFTGPRGDVALRVQAVGATLPGWLYSNAYNDKGGFLFCPFVEDSTAWIPGFEIVPD